MRLIVGLGNPGIQYAKTRHNIGRLLVEYAADCHKVKFQKKKTPQVSLACFNWNGVEVALAYPECYMNCSGGPVKRLAASLATDIHQELLIVVDDAALPFGRYRLRSRGSDGGHNGLKSVTDALATLNYPRLRIGIGFPHLPESEEARLEDYVLSPFLPEEKAQLGVVLDQGLNALRLWIKEPLSRAMNVINT